MSVLADLANAVDYDPASGRLTWRARSGAGRAAHSWNGRYAGTPAFASLDPSNGYLRGTFRKKKVYAHRAAFALTFGRWPDVIDHINGDRTDNRLANLRDCSKAENNRNGACYAASGYKGVYADGARWFAQIVAERRARRLGTFDTPEEAARAYDAAASQLHGEFARTNAPVTAA